MKRAPALFLALSLLGACQQPATAASPDHVVNAPAAVRKANEQRQAEALGMRLTDV